jgi:DNA mismatch endonuclease, patch repair protein
MRDPQVTSKIMSKIRSTGGKAETLLGKCMWSLGLRYRKHYKIRGTPDYVFLKKKIAIFCDGDFWHGKDFHSRLANDRFKNNKEYWINKISRNMQRDKDVTQFLIDNEWKVIRLWESDILKSPEACAIIIKNEFENR